jgi:hypothetical protein
MIRKRVIMRLVSYYALSPQSHGRSNPAAAAWLELPATGTAFSHSRPDLWYP